VGERASQILASHFKSLQNLSQATQEELIALDEIGPEVACSVVEFFESPLNAPFIADLLSPELGLTPTLEDNFTQGDLNGKRFVLTGTLPNLTRAEAKARIQAKGGRVLSAVSKDTDYVVLGGKAGKKLDKAKELQIPVLDEEALLKLLEE
jgi:DNA ligase (NAD+)